MCEMHRKCTRFDWYEKVKVFFIYIFHNFLEIKIIFQQLHTLSLLIGISRMDFTISKCLIDKFISHALILTNGMICVLESQVVIECISCIWTTIFNFNRFFFHKRSLFYTRLHTRIIIKMTKLQDNGLPIKMLYWTNLTVTPDLTTNYLITLTIHLVVTCDSVVCFSYCSKIILVFYCSFGYLPVHFIEMN